MGLWWQHCHYSSTIKLPSPTGLDWPGLGCPRVEGLGLAAPTLCSWIRFQLSCSYTAGLDPSWAVSLKMDWAPAGPALRGGIGSRLCLPWVSGLGSDQANPTQGLDLDQTIPTHMDRVLTGPFLCRYMESHTRSGPQSQKVRHHWSRQLEREQLSNLVNGILPWISRFGFPKSL